jgi:hypothetical protein
VEGTVFPQLSTHFMMAEQTETCSALTNFKKYLILNVGIVAWLTVNKTKLILISTTTGC